MQNKLHKCFVVFVEQIKRILRLGAVQITQIWCVVHTYIVLLDAVQIRQILCFGAAKIT